MDAQDQEYIQQLKVELEHVKVERDRFRGQIEAMARDIENLKGSIVQLTNDNSTYMAQVQKLQRELTESTRARSAMEPIVADLEALVNHFNRYRNAYPR